MDLQSCQPSPGSLLVSQASPVFSFLYIKPLSSPSNKHQTLSSLQFSLLISSRNQNQIVKTRIRSSKMMSIFSPFEAFSAESSGWKLFNFSRRPSSSASNSATQFDRKSSAPSSSAANVDLDHENSLRRETVTPVKKETENSNKIDDRSCQKPIKGTKKRNPRFAIELDGLHCFETIITY